MDQTETERLRNGGRVVKPLQDLPQWRPRRVWFLKSSLKDSYCALLKDPVLGP